MKLWKERSLATKFAAFWLTMVVNRKTDVILKNRGVTSELLLDRYLEI